MRDVARRLSDELLQWDRWAAGVSPEENGWESDAPNWRRLIVLAWELLQETNLAPAEVSLIEKVFSISEEGEEMAGLLKYIQMSSAEICFFEGSKIRMTMFADERSFVS